MEQNFTGGNDRLTNLQLELLKGLRHMATEKQIEDVRELLGNYFAQQLDEAIDKAEEERGYTAETYAGWVNQDKLNKSTKPAK